jgi:uncharacterized membrane protein YdjX (TVP38/TMEM64 family)
MQPSSRPETELGPVDGVPEAAGHSTRRRWVKVLPLAVVAAGLVLVFATGLNRYLSLEVLEARRQQLQALVHAHPIEGVLLYIGAYVAVVAFSIPGAMIMTMSGGFLFGPLLGSAGAVSGATMGATLMFLAARSAFGDILIRRARAGSAVQRLERDIRENALSSMLVMRLVPAIPFCLVNIAAACVGIPLRTYVVATTVGIIPSTFVYSSFGAGLGHVFDRGGTLDMRLLLEPQIFLPLIGLTVLSLVPIAVQAWRLRRRAAARDAPE